MKNPFNQPGRRKFRLIKAGPILLVTIFAICSCKENLTVVMYTILPPKPDTTGAPRNMMLAGSDTMLSDVSKSTAAMSVSILPPKPDTHRIARSIYSKVSSIEVNYYPSSPVSNKNAYIIGPNSEILDSARVISENKPVSFMGVVYYPTKVVFQLRKSLTSPVVKVIIPNKTLFPKGDEIFYIQSE